MESHYEHPEVDLLELKVENVILDSCTNDIEKPDPCEPHEEDV